MRFKPNVQDDGESSVEGLSNEDVVEEYILFHLKWKYEFIYGEKQKANINVLLQDKANLITTITGLKKEVKNLNSKLEDMIKSVHVLSFGSDTLDEIIGVGKTTRDMKGIRFGYNFMNTKN